MDKYTKGFVVASVVYLFLAAALGAWMGLAETPVWARFAHVHFNLLGFMAMMVYGVGYFILPRFNARELRWPSWVPVHFFTANVGLIGMVVTSGSRPGGAFAGFSLLSVLSIAMFALNIVVTMLSPDPDVEAETAAEPASPGVAEVEIGPETRVGEILSRWPETAEVFIENGFAALGDPEHREQVKQLPVTVETACSRHGADANVLLDLLRKRIAELGGNGTSARGGVQADGLSRGTPIALHHVIGTILKVYPETEGVFRKYYGAACFSCPGQATETVTQSAMMHNADPKAVLDELNKAAGIK